MKFACTLLCASLPAATLLAGLDVKTFGAAGDGVADAPPRSAKRPNA